ncbi:aldehyde dehydrogenase (acceptor) [Halovenus aranensis]|jgi:aldehyde dehydrogenase (NAD+)|uniref:Aldehyde dehydrogenase (Acceptor) n=1 Tax=Halovenus aranensis TaxID=890420 RepID=A0A1G8Y3B6_9EURY|nr:aldehyde dehydrogenase family protein [Halovenus aranensis]SDJ97359.1 aldehyde dehydrogenase (acceptor) [Halovenus aranensis]
MSYEGPTSLYIDGEWTNAAGGEELESVDPATEDVYATVAAATAEDVETAVEAAREAVETGSEWRTMAPSERASMLHDFADALESWREEITLAEARDNGKTQFEAKLEHGMVIDTLRYYAGWADKVEGSQIPVEGNRIDYTLREPVGVTGHIVPWNYPFQLAGRSIAPALACGNSLVVKPSSQTPLSALYYAKAAEEAGLPDGVINVLPGRGSVAGSALAEHDDVDHLTFTGSTEIGTEIGATAGEQVTNVTLELGGKGPQVVFPDADLGAAAQGVRYGIFMNCGQMCWAGSRLVVHEDVHDDLVEMVVDQAESIPLGDGITDNAQMGPMVSESQREEVLDYIETGKSEGATVATGGGVPEGKDEGYFVEPTVFTDVTNDMTIAREEIFGPVLSVIEVSDEEEALEVANDSPFGLMSCVWTNDLSRAHEFARDLEYGMVNVNETPNTFPQTPFGGVKESGTGREQGKYAIEEYTRVKNVNINLG